MQNVHFTPPELSRMLGVNESTIKRWIDRGMLDAERTPGGHRRITHEAIQTFLQNQGSIRNHSYLLRRWRGANQKEMWRQYYELHRDYKTAEARSLLTGVFIATGSVQQAILQLVVPTLIEVGTGWRDGQLDIADEHRITFMIRSDLLSLELLLPVPKASAPRILLACVPEENHELPLVMLSLIAREAGWQSVVLGINVPAAEIERVVTQTDIATVALARAYNSGSQRAYVRDVRGRVPKKIPIIIGGSGWSKNDITALTALTGVSHVPSIGALFQTLQQYTELGTTWRRGSKTQKS